MGSVVGSLLWVEQRKGLHVKWLAKGSGHRVEGLKFGKEVRAFRRFQDGVADLAIGLFKAPASAEVAE